MKFAVTAALISGLVASANAHAHVFGLYVNNVFQGDGRNVYIRSPPNNSPVKDVTSPSINCNVNNRAVAKSVTVKGGDTVTFEWYHDNRGDDIIDGSHVGPVTVWIADRASNGNGAVWSKIAEDGFSGGQWAVQRLIANKGKHDVKLPAGLAPGDYLLRAEIIALHEAETDFKKNPARGAQFYPSCSQITVTGTGSVKPNQNFNFNVGYTSSTPGIFFNVYTTVTSYPIPGPAVFKAGSSTGAPTVPAPTVPAPTVPAPTVPTPTSTKAPTATAKPPPPAGGSTTLAQKYQQCGGINFTGPKACAAGLRCQTFNPYYSQCL